MCQALRQGCGLSGGEDGYDPRTQTTPHQVKAGAVGDVGVPEVLRLPRAGPQALPSLTGRGGSPGSLLPSLTATEGEIPTWKSF